MTTMERLEAVFRDVFDKEDLTISEDMRAADIDGWDSLVHISLLSAVQDEFQIRFDMDEIMKMDRIGNMLARIEETCGE